MTICNLAPTQVMCLFTDFTVNKAYVCVRECARALVRAFVMCTCVYVRVRG